MSHRLSGICLLFLLLSGCAGQGVDDGGQDFEAVSTGIEIVGLEIHNGLNTTVYDVMVLVPATGGFVSCGQILARTSCSSTFPHREYRELPVKVSWRVREELIETREQGLEVSGALGQGMTAVVKVILLSEGLAATLLEPYTER